MSPTFANIDPTVPNPIPAILVSPEFQDAVRIFAESPSIKGALVSPDSQALLYCLIRLLHPTIAVEIGTYLASTTRAMARAIADNGEGELHTVDPFAIRGRWNVARWPCELRRVTRFHLINSMSYFARMQKRGLRTDLIFVDGNHDYEFALFDIQAAARLMKPGGFIVIDNIAQPGPFLAARDFMERSLSMGWRDCGTSLSRFDEPFDRHRTTIHNTDFCILRAPNEIAISSPPISFGEVAWSTLNTSLRLRPQSKMEGSLKVQFIIRVFDNPPREIIASANVEIAGGNEIEVPVPFPTSPSQCTRLWARRKIRKTIETWLTWEGTGTLRLRDFPSII